MLEGRFRKIAFAVALLMAVPAFAQSDPLFTPGNLVVAVEGCGVHGGTCTNVPNGTGNGTGNSSVGGYGDNQASLLTLFQYTPIGTSSVSFVNSLAVAAKRFWRRTFPSPLSTDLRRRATLQLSGAGQYLTIMGYGINANAFNANPTQYGVPGGELAQSGSLTGQSYTPVPRVVALIDANGNINTTTALYNIFNGNNPRSTYTADGVNIYVSGQGTSGDATGGVFFTMLGDSSAIASITGDDGGTNESQDTRTVQIANNTLYVSMDSKTGSYNRSYIGTMGSPPYTTTYSCATAPGGDCPTDVPNGPSLLTGFGNTGGTGRVKLTAARNQRDQRLGRVHQSEPVELLLCQLDSFVCGGHRQPEKYFGRQRIALQPVRRWRPAEVGERKRNLDLGIHPLPGIEPGEKRKLKVRRHNLLHQHRRHDWLIWSDRRCEQ